jgi:predicted secreted Zn-dependent protease
MRKMERRPQLDAEIKACIAKEGPMSGYRACQLIQAPKNTVIWHLKRMVINGELNSTSGPRTTIIYSLPDRHGNPPPGPKAYSRGRPRHKEG